MANETDDIVAQIDQIRDRLATNVDELTAAVSPAGLVARAQGSVRARFVDENGEVRTDVVVKIAGGAVAVLVASVLVRRVLR